LGPRPHHGHSLGVSLLPPTGPPPPTLSSCLWLNLLQCYRTRFTLTVLVKQPAFSFLFLSSGCTPPRKRPPAAVVTARQPLAGPSPGLDVLLKGPGLFSALPSPQSQTREVSLTGSGENVLYMSCSDILVKTFSERFRPAREAYFLKNSIR